MLDTPHIVETTDLTAAVIRLAVAREDLPKVMGPGISEVRAAVTAQGATAMGPWFVHYVKMDPGQMEFDIGVPVAEPIAPSGRVRSGALPAARVARTVYRGPYEGLFGAWSEFRAWIATQGLAPAPHLWECYVLGPEADPDPTTWRTELNQPLRV